MADTRHRQCDIVCPSHGPNRLHSGLARTRRNCSKECRAKTTPDPQTVGPRDLTHDESYDNVLGHCASQIWGGQARQRQRQRQMARRRQGRGPDADRCQCYDMAFTYPCVCVVLHAMESNGIVFHRFGQHGLPVTNDCAVGTRLLIR